MQEDLRAKLLTQYGTRGFGLIGNRMEETIARLQEDTTISGFDTEFLVMVREIIGEIQEEINK